MPLILPLIHIKIFDNKLISLVMTIDDREHYRHSLKND